MTFWRLVARSIAQRKLSSVLTALSVALGVMLVTTILCLRAELERTYRGQADGYGLVIGPAGSPLELVLNAVFHMGRSPGLIPYSRQLELESESWARYVRVAVPYAVGDSFRGYRVVGTTDGVFSRHFPYPRGDTPEEKMLAGRPFRYSRDHLLASLEAVVRGRVAEAPPAGHGPAPHGEGSGAEGQDRNGHEQGGAGEDGQDHGHEHGEEQGHDGPGWFQEAVLGYDVADRLDLAPGDRIEPTHGVEGTSRHTHKHLWDVVGVLKRTGTPVDRVVFINIDSFYRIPEHVTGGVIPETGEAALSSILIFPRGGYTKPYVMGYFRKQNDVQVADVSTQIGNLLDIVGNVDRVFMLVAVLVVVIGVVSVMVAIYNTMNERRRELAIMRAIGAHRATIMGTIVAESTTLAVLGGTAGVLLGHLLLFLLAEHLAEEARLLVDPLRVLPEELLLLGLVALVGALAGLLPALKAYRTDVARNLAPTT